MIFVYLNYFLIVIWFILFFMYDDYRFSATNYDFIKLEDIRDELVEKTIVPKNTQLKDCNYDTLITESTDFPVSDIYKNYHSNNVKTGGEYSPSHCNARFSVAIIVPYRNREEQLKIFINYFHHFLQLQNIHYRIFIVEQKDTKPFNRAKLLNIGALQAISYKYPCLILHDVDLIPINSGNLYVCSKQPRHLSTNIDVHRYHLLYNRLFGGAVTILADQFQAVNGMSNMFHGWGGEDDDFYMRLAYSEYLPYRFDPVISKYIMLKHKKETPSPERFEVLKTFWERHKEDGINNINFQFNVTLKPLYTHIIVYS